ncbi:MAG: nitrogenase [Firmicutes bacterium]|nr:nitrogenase [Bacillota bacterium]
MVSTCNKTNLQHLASIAVYLGKHGETASLSDPGQLMVYGKSRGGWTVGREKGFYPVAGAGMGGLRRMMREMVEFMGECRIFVGHTVTGIAYFELEKAKCTVWEMQGKPDNFLDYVMEREEKESKLGKGTFMLPVPVEVGRGRYRISIKEIQDGDSGVTSKQVLRPFLGRGEFCELEITCSHVPPWLEAEFATGLLKGEVLSTGRGEIKLVIKGTPY